MKQIKSLGQVFLKDKNYLRKIANNLIVNNEMVCEIGPGQGALTDYLIETARSICCVEVDGRFADLLRKKYADRDNVKIVTCDIRRFPLANYSERVTVVGNIPYYLSSDIIQYLIKHRDVVSYAYLTVQKEFANKLIGKIGTKEYGFLTCFLQYYAKTKKVFDIPARAFSPKPKVDSSFVSIEFLKEPSVAVMSDKKLFSVMKTAFSQRRKKIVNSLPSLKTNPNVLLSFGINPDARPENLSLKEFSILANIL